MLPTSTYCSKFIPRSKRRNSCCKTASNVCGSRQSSAMMSAISSTLSMLYCASGAMSSVAAACAGTKARPESVLTISSVFR